VKGIQNAKMRMACRQKHAILNRGLCTLNKEAGWKALDTMEIEVEQNASGDNGEPKRETSKSEIRSTNFGIADGETGVAALPDRGGAESPDENGHGTEKRELNAQPAPDRPVVGLDSLFELALENLDED
jgi:hypothetical protein